MHAFCFGRVNPVIAVVRVWVVGVWIVFGALGASGLMGPRSAAAFVPEPDFGKWPARSLKVSGETGLRPAPWPLDVEIRRRFLEQSVVDDTAANDTAADGSQPGDTAVGDTATGDAVHEALNEAGR